MHLKEFDKKNIKLLKTQLQKDQVGQKKLLLKFKTLEKRTDDLKKESVIQIRQYRRRGAMELWESLYVTTQRIFNETNKSAFDIYNRISSNQSSVPGESLDDYVNIRRSLAVQAILNSQ